MKIRLLKLKSWLLLSLTGALGLGACSGSKRAAVAPTPNPDNPPKAQPRDEIRLMYGVPTMNFRLSGRVESPQGKPVEGVRVALLEPGMEVQADTIVGDPQRVEAFLQAQGVRTDSQGRFDLQRSGRPSGEVRLFVNDTDGPAHGDFRNRVVELKVDPARVDRTNAGGFNQGTFIQQVDVRLEEK